MITYEDYSPVIQKHFCRNDEYFVFLLRKSIIFILNMMGFISDSERSLVDMYTSYLEQHVYSESSPNFDDPLFLQKLSVLQAQSFKDMVQSGIGSSLYLGELAIKENRDSINHATSKIVDTLEINQKKITSSIERGFETSNAFLAGIQKNGVLANVYLEGIEKAIESNGQSLVQIVDNQKAFAQQLSYEFFRVRSSLSNIEYTLDCIFEELRIPETQREIRFHLEQGIRFLSYAVSKKDDSYFSDALDEFQNSIQIYKRDFVSWYYIGFIYTFSISQLNMEKAIEALLHYQHIAAVLPSKHSLWDDSCLLLAQCYYLNNDIQNAIKTLGRDKTDNHKITVNRIKYLSLGNDSQKHEAAAFTEQFLSQYPYLIALLLSDIDISNNDQIALTLERLAKDKNDKALLAYTENINNLSFLNDQIQSDISKINDRVERLDTHGRIELIDKEEWIINLSEEYNKIKSLIERHSFLDSQVCLDKCKELSEVAAQQNIGFINYLKGVENRIPIFTNITKPRYINAINDEKRALSTALDFLEAITPFVNTSSVSDIYSKVEVFEKGWPYYSLEYPQNHPFASVSDIKKTKEVITVHTSTLKDLIQSINKLEWWQWDDFKTQEKSRLLELSAFLGCIDRGSLVYTSNQCKSIWTLVIHFYQDFHIKNGKGVYSNHLTSVEIPCPQKIARACDQYNNGYPSIVSQSKWRPFMLSDEEDKRQEAKATLREYGHLYKAAMDVIQSIDSFYANYGKNWNALLDGPWTINSLKFY